MDDVKINPKQYFEGKEAVVEKLKGLGVKNINITWKIPTLYRKWRKKTKTPHVNLTKGKIVSLLQVWAGQPLIPFEDTQTVVISKKRNKEFYQSWEWRKVRYEVLVEYGAVCMVCGATRRQDVICVDHIKPRSKHPELSLAKSNLQVLCNTCNMGKSNTDETDHRP